MKKLGIMLLSLCFLGNSFLEAAPAKKTSTAKHRASNIEWKTNYKETYEQAKATGKPLVLFFTGSDWCTWCTKLEREVFETPEFANSANQEFLFVLLDYPRKTSLPKHLTEQNSQLKDKYKVSSFPTVLVIDDNENIILRTGYRKGGGQSYLKHLSEAVHGHRKLHNKVEALDEQSPKQEELKQLYFKAQELQQKDLMTQVLNKALEQGRSPFFLTEKYRQLALEGQAESNEARLLKREILSSTGKDAQNNQSNLAVIDFQQRLDRMDEMGYDSDYVTQPLVAYLDQNGEKDTKNRWRMEVSIAQVLVKDKEFKRALQLMHSALKHAPEPMHDEIKEAIQNIKQLAQANGESLAY